jgi:hypothetical protein
MKTRSSPNDGTCALRRNAGWNPVPGGSTRHAGITSDRPERCGGAFDERCVTACPARRVIIPVQERRPATWNKAMNKAIFTSQKPGPDVVQKTHCDTFPKRCRHFAGVNFTDKTKRCDAGVLMSDATVMQGYRYQYDGRGAIYSTSHSLPCFKDDDPLGVCKCEHQSFPTPEEIREEKEETQKVIDRLITSRQAIVDITGGKRGVSGSIDCPICGKELHYSVASCNGHIHARCETDGCVSFME